MLTADETGGAQMPKCNTSPPKRRKKLVTKMYVDDEGAMGELLSTVDHKITICWLGLDSSRTFSADNLPSTCGQNQISCLLQQKVLQQSKSPELYLTKAIVAFTRNQMLYSSYIPSLF